MAGALAVVVPDGGYYQAVVVAHVMAVIVGFGGLIATRRLAVAGAGRLEAKLEWVVYAVPVLGVVAVMTSADGWHFSEPWIPSAFLVWVAAVGVYQVRLRPERLAGRPASRNAGLIFDALVVAATALMVMKPGA